MQNYYNYFTEIEEHFQRRRGSLLMLSTLDWALIEVWREAAVPLPAVLRGIDAAFDKHDARKATAKTRVRRINGLAWCTQEVMKAVDEMQEAAIGASTENNPASAAPGLEHERIAAHLESCAHILREANLIGIAQETASLSAARLEELAVESRTTPANLESLERTLTVMEEKLFAALTATTSDADLVGMREQAARELAPYRGRMKTVQIRQIEQQFLHKRLLERWRLPRLSLFYMSQA
ncbi:hypothetical protein ACPOL_6094 [Acidisarcina polymorpha]|uniref:Uncharacterized protein n=1 Tax=Acidisarcina polymorpha TaxID=2211140 RepID=A0A2Z5G8P5_9BACT|nr:hypothetical protein [Acidisarcina polymorpha]AXC15338.1 hypothetical protein ACPOL_6094 [Acidisarcina polymorpha]